MTVLDMHQAHRLATVLYLHFTADSGDEYQTGQGADEEAKVVPKWTILIPVGDLLQRVRHQVI